MAAQTIFLNLRHSTVKQNLLFREILRALGFRCFSSLARVNAARAADNDSLDVGVD